MDVKNGRRQSTAQKMKNANTSLVRSADRVRTSKELQPIAGVERSDTSNIGSNGGRLSGEALGDARRANDNLE